MSILSVYHVSSPALPNKVLTHLEDIASTLAEHKVIFSQQPVTASVKAGASHDDVLSAFRVQVDQLMTEHGHRVVEVISVDGRSADDAARSEYHHGSEELRYFAAGRAMVTLHIGDWVYAVQCEKNDLISIPAGTRQWFDLGEHPRLIAIRLFKDASGQSAVPTGDAMCSAFPGLDD